MHNGQNHNAEPVPGQFPGTRNADDALAGNIGEYKESEVLSGSAVSLTSTQAADITSLSLTAGDWHVWGTVATLPNAATTSTKLDAWINTTTAQAPTIPGKGAMARVDGSLVTGLPQILPTGMRRLSLSAATTVYLSCTSTFAVNTNAAYGILCACRVR